MNIDKSRFLLLFSYIGTKYSGVQRQTTRKPKNQVNPTDNTVQYYIEEALETINPKPSQEAKVSLSSRTDKGVHAFENSAVIKIVHPNSTESYYPNQIIETANTYFKTHNHDIKFNKIHLVSPEFHFRKHIKQRSYYYRLAVVKPEIANQAFFQPESYLPINELNRCSLLRTPINLDLDLMKETVQSFIGTHDFTNFAAFSKSLTYYYDGYFTRTIDQLTLTQCDLEPLEAIDPSYRNINLYEFKITSRAFLYRQIRRMIGSIIMVGSRAFPIEQFKLMLDEPEKHKWVNHYFMAPADGLYLAEIKYDPKDFLNPTNVKQLYHSGNLGPVPVNDEKESDDGFDEKEVEEDFDEDQQQFNDDKQDETFKFF